MMSITALLTWLLFILGFGNPAPCGETGALEVSDGICASATSTASSTEARPKYFGVTDISNGI